MGVDLDASSLRIRPAAAATAALATAATAASFKPSRRARRGDRDVRVPHGQQRHDVGRRRDKARPPGSRTVHEENAIHAAAVGPFSSPARSSLRTVRLPTTIRLPIVRLFLVLLIITVLPVLPLVLRAVLLLVVAQLAVDGGVGGCWEVGVGVEADED